MLFEKLDQPLKDFDPVPIARLGPCRSDRMHDLRFCRGGAGENLYGTIAGGCPSSPTVIDSNIMMEQTRGHWKLSYVLRVGGEYSFTLILGFYRKSRNMGGDEH